MYVRASSYPEALEWEVRDGFHFSHIQKPTITLSTTACYLLWEPESDYLYHAHKN